MRIKYFSKDYPSLDTNTLSIADYYILNYNLVPDYNKMNLEQSEKDGNFKIVNINKNDIIDILTSYLDKALRPAVTMDTIEVIKEYLRIKKEA